MTFVARAPGIDYVLGRVHFGGFLAFAVKPPWFLTDLPRAPAQALLTASRHKEQVKN